jgi:type I restriction enzyme, S subunit
MSPWRATTVGEEIDLLYGKPLPAEKREPGEYDVFGSNGIVGHHSKSIVIGPGIIIGRKGSVGEIAYSKKSFWPIDTTYYVSNKGNHDWRFLYHMLRNLGLTGLNSHSTIPGLSRENVLSIHLDFPGLDEQKKIATYLDLVEDKLILESLALQQTSDLKRAAMRELFTRGLRGEAQKETEIGLVPESWELFELSSIAHIERGRFLHRPRNEPRFYGGNTPFVQTGDVVRSGGRIRSFTQTLNDDGVTISRVFPKGTILITIAANIGYSGILEFDSACPDSLVAITPQVKLDVRFLEYFLQTQQPEMDRMAPKGTQKNINIQFLSPWPIPTPSLPEQRKIVEILDAIDRKIELHKKKKALLEELFTSLLHKLMTGEIRVDELDLSALTS